MLWEEVGWFWQTISVSVTSALPTSYQHSSPASPGDPQTRYPEKVAEGAKEYTELGFPAQGSFSLITISPNIPRLSHRTLTSEQKGLFVPRPA